MARSQSFDAVQPLADQAQRVDQPVDGARQRRQSVWMTSGQLADELLYHGTHRLRSVYRFLTQNGVKVCRRGKGGALLIDRADVQRAIGARRGKAA